MYLWVTLDNALMSHYYITVAQVHTIESSSKCAERLCV